MGKINRAIIIGLAIVGISIPVFIYLFYTIPSDFMKTAPASNLVMDVSSTYTSGNYFCVELSISNRGDTAVNIAKIYVNNNVYQAYMVTNNKLKPVKSFTVPPYSTLYILIKVPEEIAKYDDVININLVTASGATIGATITTQ